MRTLQILMVSDAAVLEDTGGRREPEAGATNQGEHHTPRADDMTGSGRLSPITENSHEDAQSESTEQSLSTFFKHEREDLNNLLEEVLVDLRGSCHDEEKAETHDDAKDRMPLSLMMTPPEDIHLDKVPEPN